MMKPWPNTPMPEASTTPETDSRPHVVSICGTWLKPEMQSIYRQLTGLSRVRSTVYAQWMENEAAVKHGQYPVPWLPIQPQKA